MADKNNYLSRVTYQGGKDSYEFPFSYLRKNFVKAQIDLSESESNTLAYMVDYTIDGHTLKLTKPVDVDKTITIYRETSSTPLVEYEDSSILRAYDLNLSQRQNLNILEEQTDIVEESYSLTQDTKASMDKNIMDTKTAIDNVNATKKSVDDAVAGMNTTVANSKKYVDDSVAGMNTTVANSKKYVDDSVAKMNTTVANSKKYVDDSVAGMNTTVANSKKYVDDSVAKMNTTVADTKKYVDDSVAKMNTTVANTKKSVDDSLATTTTNLNDAINTATSSMDSKLAQTSQALEDAQAALETTKSTMEKELADTQASLKDTENRVNATEADITKLADELKESESSLQDAIKNINTTNRNMAYEVGDQIHSSYLPFNCYITCVTAGTTGDTLPVIPAGGHDSGFTYTDGTATFKMDYWPLSINGNKPLNKAGDIMIKVDKVNESNHAAMADRATKVTAVAPSGGTADLVSCTMGNDDIARISVGGSADKGWLEIATADNGNEPIYVRQYVGLFGQVANEAVLLDGSGNTKFPHNVTAANFVGHLTGNADTATTADSATSASVLNNSGNQTAITGAAEGGLRLYKVDNNGYPTRYGNVLSIGGKGDGQILAGWSTVDNGIERLYYRNRRDTCGTWSVWKTVAYYDDINALAPTKTGGGASGTWGINISGNADTVDGYHASDLLRTLGGNRTPVIVDIFDRAGTIDMTTMSDADKATHKANINKALNASQNIWNNTTGIRAYGGDYDINGYNHGTLKLTQSWKNFDKLMIVYTDDDGDRGRIRIFDIYEFDYCMTNMHSINLFMDDGNYWNVFGFTKHGDDSGFKPSTETILSCSSQKSGLIGIYGIKY